MEKNVAKSDIKQLPDIPITPKRTFLSRKLIFQIILIGLIISFAALTYIVKNIDYTENDRAYFSFDLKVTLIIQSIDFALFDFLMKAVTLIGNWPLNTLSILIATSVAYLYKRSKAASFILLSGFGSLILSGILKIWVLRPRPDPTLINQIGSFINSDSFPSGHVLSFMGLYGFLLFLTFSEIKKSLWQRLVQVALILFIGLVGLSRIYLGAHWFSDVLGAYLVGSIWLYLMIFLYSIYKTK